MWKRISVLILIALLHFGVTFVSWSLTPGNAAVETSHLFSTVWGVCSFPLIMCLPNDIIDLAFMPLLFLNSCIWSGIIFIVFCLNKKRMAAGRRIDK